jgi:hypothetical protein
MPVSPYRPRRAPSPFKPSLLLYRPPRRSGMLPKLWLPARREVLSDL